MTLKHLCLVAAFALAACAATPEPKVAASKPTAVEKRILAVMVSYLPGTHRSIVQDKGPGTGTTVRVAAFWPEREKEGEYWMYVEHSRDGNAKPFRQRIYRFTGGNHTYAIDVFALPGNPDDFAGEWRKPKPFDGYTPAQLREYPGCTMEIGHMESMFWAHTKGTACRTTDDPKVHHERTDMFASTAGMKEGTFGFDAAGRQVAGEAAVWDFRRRAELR